MEDSDRNPAYASGSCNIGVAEIARRYRIGYFGLACTAITVLSVEILDADRIWRLAISLPVAVAWTGFLQARQRFCLKYGFQGVFSTYGMRKLTKVKDSDDLQKDRHMALSLTIKAILGTVLCTIFYYLLPKW